MPSTVVSILRGGEDKLDRASLSVSGRRLAVRLTSVNYIAHTLLRTIVCFVERSYSMQWLLGRAERLPQKLGSSIFNRSRNVSVGFRAGLWTRCVSRGS